MSEVDFASSWFSEPAPEPEYQYEEAELDDSEYEEDDSDEPAYYDDEQQIGQMVRSELDRYNSPELAHAREQEWQQIAADQQWRADVQRHQALEGARTELNQLISEGAKRFDVQGSAANGTVEATGNQLFALADSNAYYMGDAALRQYVNSPQGARELIGIALEGARFDSITGNGTRVVDNGSSSQDTDEMREWREGQNDHFRRTHPSPGILKPEGARRR